MDPLDPPAGLRDLIARHRCLDGGQSLLQIARRHDGAKTVRFLEYNTYLMKTPTDKPDVDQRTAELGVRLKNDQYDVMALCEVWDYNKALVIPIWNDSVKREVLQGWGWPLDDKQEWPLDHARYARGPGAAGFKMDSGLLQICANPGYKIVSSAQTTFNDLGAMGADAEHADWWSEKGILVTCIDLGVGILEVYGTHLYSGHDVDVYRSNVNDLAQFFREQHNPRNIAIVCGDLNIDARGRDTDPYGALVGAMDGLEMEDVWLKHRGDATHAGYDGVKNAGGYTNTFDNQDDAAKISSEMSQVGPPSEKDSNFCAEPLPGDRPGDRVDYIFLEKPNRSHSFAIDASRIRRRTFLRGVASDMPYLSDHLGLDVTLFASALA
jgi:endonuclease/exonuclease/phosphatase family metal-dependent hydrolase